MSSLWRGSPHTLEQQRHVGEDHPCRRRGQVLTYTSGRHRIRRLWVFAFVVVATMRACCFVVGVGASPYRRRGSADRGAQRHCQRRRLRRSDRYVNVVATQATASGFNDSARNVGLIALFSGCVAGSWWLTAKWWKLPLLFALPSMMYRLWTTRGDTIKLAEVSASVDKKYVATSERAQKELRTFTCGSCGYTLFPARGREAAFFTESFKCPMCGAKKDDFLKRSQDEYERARSREANTKSDATPEKAIGTSPDSLQSTKFEVSEPGIPESTETRNEDDDCPDV